MDMMYDFIRFFALGLAYTLPLLLFFILIITLSGLVVGKWEKWAALDAMYFSFISATTVGFGDFHPKRKLSKLLSIVIATVGLVFTGIVIAVALHAATLAFKNSP
jgi:voltage-gated potassium channel